MKKIFNIFLCLILTVTFLAGSLETAAALPGAPEIEGTAGIIYCTTCDEEIWSLNSGKKYNLASITKLMTCLLAIEQLGLDKQVTVSAEAEKVDRYEAVVSAGEKLTVRDLVHQAMLVSANDSAKALGIAVSGSEKKFAALMNERAEKIGCTGTNFKNASGIAVKNQYSTAADIVKIAKEAFANEELRKIAGTKEYTVHATNMREEKKYENHNYLLFGGTVENGNSKINVKKYKGVFGGKTGTTDKQRANMVVGCDFDGLEVYVVVLDSTINDRYSDVKKLLDYAKESINRYEAFPQGKTFEKAKLKKGATNKVEGVATEAGVINLPEGASASLVTVTPVYDEKLEAPIKKGQIIGHVEIHIADELSRSIELAAAEDVKVGWFLSPFGITNLQTVVIFTMLAFIIIFVITILVMRARNKKRRKLARAAKLRKIALQQIENEREHRQRNWPY